MSNPKNSNQSGSPVDHHGLVRPLPEYTYEDGEGPKCPFCGAVWAADDPAYYDENGFEDECPECENHIRIEPEISVAWRTHPIRWANVWLALFLWNS